MANSNNLESHDIAILLATGVSTVGESLASYRQAYIFGGHILPDMHMGLRFEDITDLIGR